METEKKPNVEKKILDTLKENLQSLTNEEEDRLSGGFASIGTENEEDGIVDINTLTDTTNKCSINNVAGCHGGQPPTTNSNCFK